MSLRSTREYYKPFDHPWMFDYWDLQQQMHWIPNDVPLNTDVKDWNNTLNINLTGVFCCLQSQIQCMLQNGFGRIVKERVSLLGQFPSIV